jgi:O-antigen ligase
VRNNIEKILRLEFLTLCALAFSLPLFEGPKHLFCFIYLTIFIYRSVKFRDTLDISPLGKYILFFIGLSIISSIGASYNGYNVIKLHDIIRYSLIGWMALHTPLSRKRIYIICATLIISTFIACIDAHYMLHTVKSTYFELRSVGHINHSSIFILLISGITLPLLLLRQNQKTLLLCFLITNIAIFYYLLKTNSRATFIGFILIIITTIIFIIIKNKKAIYIVLITLSLSIAAISINPPNVINKIIGKHKYYSEKMTPREKSWNTSYYVWKKEPFFGIGYGNYQIITPEKMLSLYKNSNLDFTNKELFIYLPHSHNRYVNTLTEGGLIGLIGLLILFGGIFYHIMKSIKFLKNKENNIFFFLIACNTFITITIVGLFNTTLHHEHGLLAMLLIGLSFNYLHNKKLTTTT